MPPVALSINDSCESHTYSAIEDCLVFLSNFGQENDCTFSNFPTNNNTSTVVPPWSVSIITGHNCSNEIFNTKKSLSTSETENKQMTNIVPT